MITTHGNGAPRQESAAQEIASTTTHDTRESRSPGPVDPETLREWGKSRLDRATATGKCYFAGTPKWAALDDDDPRKSAAVIWAALQWCDEQARRADFHQYLDVIAEKQAAVDVSVAGMSSDQRSSLWASGRPSFAELQRRRAVVPPMPRFDPVAAARWVATGSSKSMPQERAA